MELKRLGISSQGKVDYLEELSDKSVNDKPLKH